MSGEELKAIINKQRELGLSFAVLTMPVPSGLSNRYPLKVRTPFGLARWYPSADPERILIYVEVDKLERYYKKASRE